MDVYKKMYLRLFNRVTDALALLERGDPSAARELLIRAQQETEELFLCESEQRDRQD